MSQLSINLAAIAVFVTTFSVLLSPLVNLSPTIPAVATFTLLGLATVDSFTWQGQGGTLILDWLARMTSAEHRERIIKHEAGHFLVAYLLDIPISSYALNAWEAFQQGQAAQGGVQFDDRQLNEQLQKGQITAQMLDRYCTVWMAGIAAETIAYDNATGGAEDRLKLQAVLSQINTPINAQLKARWAALQARTLIEANLKAYEALVTAMEQRASVAECQKMIQANLN
ncbi:ATP-dependent Zn protease [Planktothricoides raciborskii]|uniref:ATP-dependent Zn protease n=2 Tax=Planktothricoides raciborskii TaxID=132608 RepID=A0AAU8JCM7_9CYAN|nr:ATP-dependent Zn protease [Planktothricoides raciborskii]MBD2542418.1 ATP-dependent Zn protease [Planktothricoides raciborskii FACHB-1370]MBD2582087.1 ATP-dependent Zn protease [Planktothricoides raciborskii FACHB-1261]